MILVEGGWITSRTLPLPWLLSSCVSPPSSAGPRSLPQSGRTCCPPATSSWRLSMRLSLACSQLACQLHRWVLFAPWAGCGEAGMIGRSLGARWGIGKPSFWHLAQPWLLRLFPGAFSHLQGFWAWLALLWPVMQYPRFFVLTWPWQDHHRIVFWAAEKKCWRLWMAPRIFPNIASSFQHTLHFFLWLVGCIYPEFPWSASIPWQGSRF